MNQEKGLTFEKVSIEEARSVVSPAEHIAQMNNRDIKYSTPDRGSVISVEDGEKREQIIKTLENPINSPDSKGEAFVQKSPVKDESVQKFLGGTISGGSKHDIGVNIEIQNDINKRKINESLIPATLFPAAVGTLASIVGWVAAGSGIGVSSSIMGVPLMTAITFGAAPLGVGIGVLGGCVWAIRRIINARNASRARSSLSAM